MSSPAAPRRQPGTKDVQVVCLPGRIEVFDDLDAAREFASQDPGASRRSVPLRHGTEATAVVLNRRVVIRDGLVRSVRQSDLIDFHDGDFPLPEADVEAYEKDSGEWHIVGFGTDRRLLAQRMEQAAAPARLKPGESLPPVQ